jgi:hypothetical protein
MGLFVDFGAWHRTGKDAKGLIRRWYAGRQHAARIGATGPWVINPHVMAGRVMGRNCPDAGLRSLRGIVLCSARLLSMPTRERRYIKQTKQMSGTVVIHQPSIMATAPSDSPSANRSAFRCAADRPTPVLATPVLATPARSMPALPTVGHPVAPGEGCDASGSTSGMARVGSRGWTDGTAQAMHQAAQRRYRYDIIPERYSKTVPNRSIGHHPVWLGRWSTSQRQWSMAAFTAPMKVTS